MQSCDLKNVGQPTPPWAAARPVQAQAMAAAAPGTAPGGPWQAVGQNHSVKLGGRAIVFVGFAQPS
eukprot:6969655-Pyramimonas_sp.AAC.1